MKNFIIAILLVGVLGELKAFAHNGHDHDAPTTIRAPKGGLIKALDEARVEVVPKGKNIKIHVYDTEMKSAPTSRFKVTAEARLPRAKKVEVLALKENETFFEGNYDAKGAHRVILKLAVTDSKTGRTDILTFNIEPRK